MNLRERAESDLAITLEDPTQFGLPVELTGPDGKEYNTSANSPDPLNPLPLYGQVLYTTVRVSPETGEEMVTNAPVVVLRRSSLERIPQDGENWHIRFPKDPSLTGEFSDYVFTPDRASEGGRSIGFIRLYPSKVDQSS
jgi:hypothetical protein